METALLRPVFPNLIRGPRSGESVNVTRSAGTNRIPKNQRGTDEFRLFLISRGTSAIPKKAAASHSGRLDFMLWQHYGKASCRHATFSIGQSVQMLALVS